jgi:restriction system protein
MAKRKQSGIELSASMPWQAGVLLGLIGYLAIRFGIGWYVGGHTDPLSAGIAKDARDGMLAPLAWMLLVGCWIGALVSFVKRHQRRRLLDSQTGIESLRAMRWSEFELLAGEAFRRQGYAVEETGLGGADGGIDLILRRNGQTTLVQCKQWQNRQVGVKVVREMYGLLVHHQAAAVKIVALGDYTPDAHRFAQGKPIELIHGGELIATVRSLQKSRTRATGLMDTPLALCGSMVASLLVIAVLSSSTTTALVVAAPVVAAPAVIQAAYRPQSPYVPRPAVAPTPHAQATIYASESQNDAELREWKKRNAESMRILEKTTKEMPLR